MRRTRVRVAGAVAFVLMTWTVVQACGPNFEDDVFVRTSGPDSMATFAAGQLGLLQSGYDSGAYAIAYRYLNGGTLSAEERAPYEAKPAAAQDWRAMTPSQVEAAQEAQKQAAIAASAPGEWLAARNQYAPALAEAVQKAQFPADYDGSIVFDPNYLNCPDAAFRTAALTVTARADTWGAKSAWLANWIAGQDAVFANCSRNPVPEPWMPLAPWTPPGQKPQAAVGPSVPGTAPADAPALLTEDRAYQTAAAAFYAKQYDAAVQAFEAIATDAHSPWSPWGTYLAARALVRKAFAMGKPAGANGAVASDFDRTTMLQAQALLEGLQSHPEPSRHAVDQELNFIRIRTEPEKRVAEIDAALAGPGPDANFRQDLNDLSYSLEDGIKIENPPPLLAWIEGWREKSDDAAAEWQKNHELPWLVLALSTAQSTDAATPELLRAAARVGTGSPAYDTVFFHRVRLLTALGQRDQARRMLDARLRALDGQMANSYGNALLSERLAVARNSDEFLKYAPRIVLAGLNSGADEKFAVCLAQLQKEHRTDDCEACSREPQPGFDVDAVKAMNQEMPLTMWVQAARDQRLPGNLHQDIVMAGWTRAVVLEDAATVAELAPMLPEDVRKAAGTGAGFSADVTILRNPGLRPYLEPGISRLETYGALDEMRDNWWGGPWMSNNGQNGLRATPTGAPPFLTGQEKARGEAEWQRVMQEPTGAVVIGQRVVVYATAHADDPLAPEALALTVRATHYGAQAWSSDQDAMKARQSEGTEVGKAAFTLLHRRYPQSAWAKKTPYYY